MPRIYYPSVFNPPSPAAATASQPPAGWEAVVPVGRRADSQSQQPGYDWRALPGFVAAAGPVAGWETTGPAPTPQPQPRPQQPAYGVVPGAATSVPIQFPLGWEFVGRTVIPAAVRQQPTTVDVFSPAVSPAGGWEAFAGYAVRPQSRRQPANEIIIGVAVASPIQLPAGWEPTISAPGRVSPPAQRPAQVEAFTGTPPTPVNVPSGWAIADGENRPKSTRQRPIDSSPLVRSTVAAPPVGGWEPTPPAGGRATPFRQRPAVGEWSIPAAGQPWGWDTVGPVTGGRGVPRSQAYPTGVIVRAAPATAAPPVGGWELALAPAYRRTVRQQPAPVEEFRAAPAPGPGPAVLCICLDGTPQRYPLDGTPQRYPLDGTPQRYEFRTVRKCEC